MAQGGKVKSYSRHDGCLGQGAISSTPGYCVVTPQIKDKLWREERERRRGDFLLTWHFQMKRLRKLVKSSEINEKFPPLLKSSHNRGEPFKCKQMSFKTLKRHVELQSQSAPPPKALLVSLNKL